jgi:ribosome biogenesis GTPase
METSVETTIKTSVKILGENFSDNVGTRANTHSLNVLGWDAFFQERQLREYAHCTVGRVLAENKTNYLVADDKGELLAEVSGRLLYETDEHEHLPKVGDWVYLTRYDEGRALIHAVVERKTILARTKAGRGADVQIIATNLDRLFIVQSLDNNFNLRRLERYLSMTDGTGIEPVVVLNKADICPNPHEHLAEVQEELRGVRAVMLSAVSEEGLESLQALCKPRTTIAFVGSSGVGKSTLVNKLLGAEHQATSPAREQDAKGRHTTTRREMVILPNGCLVIDTPGMRELHLSYNDEQPFDAAFGDISALAAECRFSDCTHQNEAGCAVQAAITDGRISEGHLRNFQKLQREQQYLETRQSPEAQRLRREQGKRVQKQFNAIIRGKR